MSLMYIFIIYYRYPLKWPHIYYSVATPKIVNTLLSTNLYSNIPYVIGIIPDSPEYFYLYK